jgi:hypothetical protein
MDKIDKIKNNKCNSKNKLAIIVPFRDLHKEQKRTEHFKKFLKEIPKFLDNSDISYTIYFIEQSNDNRKFNRGKISNIGFEIAYKDGCNIFIFHDIDLIPSIELLEYYITYPESPIHISNVSNKYNYKSYMGGITSFSSKDFIKINGYPNNFWGWGGEDDELYNRVVNNKLKIIKPDKGTITDLENINMTQKLIYLSKHKKLKCPYKFELLSSHKNTWKKNGLSNLKYSELKRLNLQIKFKKNVCGSAIKITVDVNFNNEYTDSWSSLDFLPSYTVFTNKKKSNSKNNIK